MLGGRDSNFAQAILDRSRNEQPVAAALADGPGVLASGGDAVDAPRAGPGRPSPSEASPTPGRSSLLRRPTLGGPGGPLAPEAALNRLVEQLDEALGLLRAIDAKLGRDR